MPKVFVVGGGASYENMFTSLGWKVVPYMEKADFIQFTGGADVSPDFYGEFIHPTTYSDRARDLHEAKVYQRARELSIPCLGICRGAQLLNVLNGGSLFQHVDNHALHGFHNCVSQVMDKKVKVTSTHHQMMRMGDGGELEGHSYNLSKVKQHMPERNSIVSTVEEIEPEVIWYEETKSLCFQPHPEHYGADDSREYYFTLINHYFH